MKYSLPLATCSVYSWNWSIQLFSSVPFGGLCEFCWNSTFCHFVVFWPFAILAFLLSWWNYLFWTMGSLLSRTDCSAKDGLGISHQLVRAIAIEYHLFYIYIYTIGSNIFFFCSLIKLFLCQPTSFSLTFQFSLPSNLGRGEGKRAVTMILVVGWG